MARMTIWPQKYDTNTLFYHLVQGFFIFPPAIHQQH